MKLRYSPTSPYVRKVAVTAIELGIDDRIERILTNPWVEDRELERDNPLGKVPVLITDDNLTLYDSPVICEYLDTVYGGGNLIPHSGLERWQVLRLQALSDGILDASVLCFLELKRAEELRSDDWLTLQRNTIQRGLDALESEVTAWEGALNLGQIAAGCALAYMDLRFADEDWRPQRSALSAWFEQFSARTSVASTKPPQPTPPPEPPQAD